MEREEGAVPLVLLPPAVREVVADQAGVNAVTVLTAEVAGLLHSDVKVQ